MTRALLIRSLRVLAIATLISAGAVPSLWAEPITVTSGRFVVPWDDPTFFRFFGADGFELSGLFAQVPTSPQRTCFTGCLPGTGLDLSAVAGGESVSTHFTLGLSTGAIINGTEFLRPFGLQLESPRLAGTLRFDAPVVVLPSLEGMVFGANFSAPFVFNGQVTGFAANDLDALMPLFQVALTGQGTADVFFSRLDGMYGVPSATYTFAATPEPTTLALLGTGLVGLVARVRTKRRQA